MTLSDSRSDQYSIVSLRVATCQTSTQSNKVHRRQYAPSDMKLEQRREQEVHAVERARRRRCSIAPDDAVLENDQHD